MSEPEWLNDWLAHGTAFTVGVTSCGGFGNGVAVDAQTVVTCAHVVCDPKLHAGVADRPTPDWTAVAYDWQKQPWRLRVQRSGFDVGVDRIYFHRRLDLAVLHLRGPIPGRRAPILKPPTALHGLTAWEPYLRDGGEEDVNCIQALPVQFQSAASRGAIKVNLGLPEGSSGSGVFVETYEGPALAALAARGGRFSAIGEFIHGEAVLAFLSECGHPPKERPTAAQALKLWAGGICPEPIPCALPGDAKAQFVPLGIVDGARIWIANNPACNLSAGRDGPERHPLKRATRLTRNEAREAIELLDGGSGLIAGLQARLPTKAEMLRAHQVALGAVNLPGPGEAEWIDDAEVAALRHDAKSNPPFAEVYDQRCSSEVGFRLVLEEKRA